MTDIVEFTDEEGYGKYLDLHECYEKFINLKGIEVKYRMKYTTVKLILSHRFIDRPLLTLP